jgi:hypothetical protein
MYTNVNLAAPVGVLAFLGTGVLLFIVGLVLIYSIVRKKLWLTKLSDENRASNILNLKRSSV